MDWAVYAAQWLHVSGAVLWLGSTLTLLIPVVSSIAAWIWLDEPLTWIQIAAMAVVLGALATIVMSQRQPEPVRAPQAATT